MRQTLLMKKTINSASNQELFWLSVLNTSSLKKDELELKVSALSLTYPLPWVTWAEWPPQF